VLLPCQDADASVGLTIAPPGRVLSSLKRSSFSLSKRLGLSTVVAQSGWRRERLLILCYHGISLADEHEWKGDLYVSPAQFERQMALVQRNECTVLPLGEALQRLYSRDLPERAVVLTFDDGYYDFLARAWPVLRRFGFPATVYLTTGRVDHNFPVINPFISYLLWKGRKRTLDTTGLTGLGDQYPLADAAQRQALLTRIGHVIAEQGLTAPQKDRLARDIAERLALDYQELLATRLLRLMRPEEVGGLSRQGADIQLHTHHHRTPEDAALFVSDVRHNRERIEAMTGRRPEHLCYPSGVYRPSYMPELRREGIVSATTCDPGMAAPAADPLLLPRFVGTTNVTDIEFEAWLTGVASCLPRRTTRAHPALH
jgi:peptidoglycan/xylan/chitin deacetylase (PgdA/CDA1 family)